MAKTKQERLDARLERQYYRTHRHKVKKKPSDIIFYIIDYTIFGLFTIVCFFPFYYLFINTISDRELVARGVINFIPKGLTIQNYLDMLALGDLGRAFLVTLARTVI